LPERAGDVANQKRVQRQFESSCEKVRQANHFRNITTVMVLHPQMDAQQVTEF
jgi:hypothetical protein